jgi:hypothetical protein
MSRDEWSLSLRQFPFDEVQIGAAHAAGSDPKKHLACRQLRLGSLFDLKRLFNGLEGGDFQVWLIAVRECIAVVLTAYRQLFRVSIPLMLYVRVEKVKETKSR